MEDYETRRKRRRAEWYQENKARINARLRDNRGFNRHLGIVAVDKNDYMRQYHAIRRKNDINYKISYNLRARVRTSLKQNKPGSVIKDLGCSVEELKVYLASKFTENMSWDNYGEWHIDHIKPLVSFNMANREEFLIACHYSNLQPLWAKDNLIKGCKT